MDHKRGSCSCQYFDNVLPIPIKFVPATQKHVSVAVDFLIDPPAAVVAAVHRSVDRWRLKRVAEPWIYNTAAQEPEAILAPKTVDEDALERAREFGAGLGEGIAQGIF